MPPEEEIENPEDELQDYTPEDEETTVDSSEEGEETNDAPTEEAAEAPVADVQPSKPYTPAFTPSPLITPERRARAAALGFDDDQLDFVQGLIQSAVAQSEQAMLQSGALYESQLSSTPVYAQAVGPRIRAIMAQMPPEQRADPQALNIARTAAIMQEVHETGESFDKVLTRHAQMLSVNAAPSTKPKGPVTKPATASVPKPSVGSGGGGRQTPRSSTERDIQSLMSDHRLTRAEAERALADEQV